MGAAGKTSPLQRAVGELVGTYFLVLTVGCNIISGSIGTALAVGAVLTSMILAIGPISGAHLNPAVTASVAVAGRFASDRKEIFGEVANYVLAQLFGGIFAGSTFALLSGKSFHLEPVGRFDWMQAATLEVLYTAALCYVVLGVTSKGPGKGQHSGGLAIGFTVTAAALAIGGISGCCLNPAVAIGVATANVQVLGLLAVARSWLLYVTAPLLGSILGVGFHLVACPPAEDLQ